MPGSSPRVRNWCFTINNPTNDQEPTTWRNVESVVWQKERSESGTLHLQGVVNFGAQKTLVGCKKLSPTGHWEPMNGTWAQATEYCTKEETRVSGPWSVGMTDGQAHGSGARTDLLAVKTAIDKGTKEKELWQSHFNEMNLHWRSMLRYRMVSQEPRSWNTETTVICGPTGKGKTTWVETHCTDAYWHMPGQGKWFDGYDGHKTVVFDEFCGMTPFNQMLRLMDHSPCMVETKGGSVNFVARRIFILSNVFAEKWYEDMKMYATRWPSFERRINNYWEANQEELGKFSCVKGTSQEVLEMCLQVEADSEETEEGIHEDDLELLGEE